jgi:hypothetical protein
VSAGFQLPRDVRRVLESLVAVVCPPEAMELGLAADLVDHVELTVGALPAPFRLGLVTGVRGFEVAALAWPPGRATRASRLSPELLERWFRMWIESPILPQRELTKAMRQVLTLAHYEHPIIQERIGYRPADWIAKVKTRRLAMYADDINRHQASLIAPDPLPGHAGKRRAGAA